jgi:Divergent InlB B-repeat domain
VRAVVVLLVAALAVVGLARAATPGTVAAAQPTLAVVVLGSGSVTSAPAGIACPGRCKATFAAGTRVVLTATPRNGARFLRWGGSCGGAGTCRVTVSALAAVAAQFEAGTPAPSGREVAQAGSYTGSNGQNGNGFTLWVAPGGRSALNVTDPLTGLSCVPAGSGLGDHLRILKAAIRPNGSFSAKTTQTGIVRGFPATFTYTVKGRFQRATQGRQASAEGTWREDVVLGGQGGRCTSNEQSWTATHEQLPVPQRPVVQPGNYSGSNGQNGNGFTLTVTPDAKSVVNVTDPLTGLGCTPSGSGLGDRLRILRAAIAADGSFAAKTTQDGVIRGRNARFTYTVSGWFMGPTAAGPTTVGGIWREDVEFSDGERCTSNEQIWTVTRS